MTRVRWIAEMFVFTAGTLLVFAAAAPFRHPSTALLVVLSPVLIVFVVVPAARILRRESTAFRKSFTWWQGLWLVMFLSGLVFRVRDEYDLQQSAVDAWALYRIALDAIVALALVERLLTQKAPWLRSLFRGLIGIATLFPLLCFLSTGWSVAPGFTAFRASEYMLDLSLLACIVVSLNSVEDCEKFANWSWTLLALLAGSAWIGALFDPGDALVEGYSFGPLHFRLEGVCPGLDANSIGEFCAILASIALCRLLDDPDRRYDRSWYRLIFGAAIATLFFSQTRAAIAAFLVCLILLFILTRRLLLGAVLGVSSSLIGVVIVCFTHLGSTISSYLLRGDSVSQAEALSGRAEMWQFAMQRISERPWLGYGGYAGGRFVVLPGLGIPGKSDVLNSFVEGFLDVGIWGPLALFLVLLGIFWYLLRSSQEKLLRPAERHLAIECLLVITVVSLRSVVSGNITSHPAVAFLTVLGCAEFLRRRMMSERRARTTWTTA